MEQNVQAVFAELRTLKPTEPGLNYTVRVAGTEETGVLEHFLRRRTAQEVSDSGLSCGCGDYALLFIARVESRGFNTLLVDSAEISSNSLQNHFSGHAVVAIRSKTATIDAPWWLVDSTNLKILSQNWSPTEKNFQASGCVFWIGYCGPLTEYPVHNPNELRAFYVNTLTQIPREFLNHTLRRFKFTVDPSLKDKDGQLLNPRLADFLRLQSRILTENEIEPEREISILLVRGRDDAHSTLTHSPENGWTGRIGLRSGCSASLLSYFEQSIRRSEQHPAN